MKNASIALAAVFGALLLGSCNSDPLTSPNPERTGTLWGTTMLRDQFGYFLTDHAGIAVKAEGTSIATTTDSAGRWKLEKLPAGSYTLTFSRAGFGMQKLFGVQFVGNGDAFVDYTELAAIPSMVVEELSVRPVDTMPTQSNFHLKLSQPVRRGTNGRRAVIVFYGTDPNVSAAPGHSIGTVQLWLNVDTFGSPDSTNVWRTEFGPEILAPRGTRLYLIAYACAFSNSIRYLNPYTGQQEYTAISPRPSNVVEFVVP